ncbi:hypothetical protein [Azonexus hydrophilus]|uniref:Phosphoglycerate mutase n=1 Tax=Azonexus hydrophilus TaxID=418702 RepID=A0ABZ2XDC5_9RHOO|nr:hypothetical protein [Azonexus hydrophilus]
MRLTLLVPELIWPEPGDPLTLDKLPAPGFEWLDGHAVFRRSAPVSLEQSLVELFGVPAGGPAAFRRLGEAGAVAEDGHWLCADPVHLRFHHERIVLADAGAFDVDETEAQALVAALNAEFADIGVFHAATARRWYLRLHQPAEHVAAPLSAVAGRRMDSDLSDKTSPLHRWLNEVQMFLHLHPVNAARAGAGKPAINSLWLWGAGTAGQPAAAFDALFADDTLAVGLGRAACLAVHGRPENLGEVLAAKVQAPLVVLDQLLPTILYENPEGWRQAFTDLDSHWFAPLRAQQGKTVHQLDIVAPTIYGRLQWTITGGERWKFWKKGRSPAAIANALAATAPEGRPS